MTPILETLLKYNEGLFLSPENENDEKEICYVNEKQNRKRKSSSKSKYWIGNGHLKFNERVICFSFLAVRFLSFFAFNQLRW